MAIPGLTIEGGRVLDPSTGVDRRGDLHLSDGLISDTPASSPRIIDATGCIVVPGLVDLHVHVYEGTSPFGIDVERHCLRRGVTTAVDAGSAGARHFTDFSDTVLRHSPTKLYAFLNISMVGLTVDVGELSDSRWLAADRTLEVASTHEEIVGIKIRLGARSAGAADEPRALRTAKAVAQQAGLPLMVHISAPSMPLDDTLAVLTNGDVVTHCFHGKDGGILDSDGRVRSSVRQAVARGVRLDIGHGRSGFSYRVARTALAADLLPHSISSDIHSRNVDGPAYDLTTAMSKLLHVGMALEDVVAAATTSPAMTIGRSGGTLRPGSTADVTVLEPLTGRWELESSRGESEPLEHLLVPRWVVTRGRPIRLAPSVHER
jgi:dihydroorotase